MIFKVAGRAQPMATGDFQNNGMKSIGLVVLFLLSLLSPLLMTPTSSPSLDETEAPGFTGPFTQTSGYGHDFAGTTLDVDGLVQVSVREESMLDLWSTEVLSLIHI